MRILLVEDQPDLVRTISRSLREADYTVETAPDGTQGLEKALEFDYDLIVLDVLLPKLNGWDLLAALRQKKKTPVLMLTARDALPDRVRGLNSGADDYLTKPFEFEELHARINAIIRRSAGQAVPLLQVGDVRIDTVAKKVYRSEKEVPLTAREFSLLEFLAMHRGEVITRTRLYDHLLGEDDDTMSNLMDVYVGNLRRKLGNELISTRRGLGYCVE